MKRFAFAFAILASLLVSGGEVSAFERVEDRSDFINTVRGKELLITRPFFLRSAIKLEVSPDGEITGRQHSPDNGEQPGTAGKAVHLVAIQVEQPTEKNEDTVGQQDLGLDEKCGLGIEPCLGHGQQGQEGRGAAQQEPQRVVDEFSERANHGIRPGSHETTHKGDDEQDRHIEQNQVVQEPEVDRLQVGVPA